MQIVDRFRVQLNLPIRHSERRADGLGLGACSLEIQLIERWNIQLLGAVIEHVLPSNGVLVGAVLGDFGQEVSEATPELIPVGSEEWARNVFLLGNRESIHALLAANTEAVALFRSVPDVESVLLAAGRQLAPWWKLSTKSEIAALASSPGVLGPLALYSVNHSAVTIMGGEHEVIAAFDHLRRWSEGAADGPSP